jgi:hypothetical protein
MTSIALLKIAICAARASLIPACQTAVQVGDKIGRALKYVLAFEAAQHRRHHKIACSKSIAIEIRQVAESCGQPR